MEKIGLVDNIYQAAMNIDFGRKGFAARGKEQEGRISYENGITSALSSFEKAQVSADPHIVILSEYTFISQELQFCDETDEDTSSSLTQAVQSFDDAFLALKVAEEKTHYQAVENCTPRKGKYRVSGFPKDSFHIACISHRTRLQNILRAPGIDPIEKALLKQRLINLSIAQNSYVKKQRKALALHKNDVMKEDLI